MKTLHEFKPQRPAVPMPTKLHEQRPKFHPPAMPAKRSHVPIGRVYGGRSR